MFLLIDARQLLVQVWVVFLGLAWMSPLLAWCWAVVKLAPRWLYPGCCCHLDSRRCHGDHGPVWVQIQLRKRLLSRVHCDPNEYPIPWRSCAWQQPHAAAYCYFSFLILKYPGWWFRLFSLILETPQYSQSSSRVFQPLSLWLLCFLLLTCGRFTLCQHSVPGTALKWVVFKSADTAVNPEKW